MEFEELMRTRFRENLPTFVAKINPIELLPYLPCLGDHNSEEVMSCQTTRTRNQAVQILHGHLIRKKDGCRQLIAALRSNSIKQAELADLLDPPKSSEPRSLGPQAGQSEESPKARPERPYDTVEITRAGPIDGSTLLRDLPASVVYVYKMLDLGVHNNWMKFATQLDIYTSPEIDYLERQSSPGRAVVNDWMQKQNPTLQMLIRKLDEIERKDMIDELEKITQYKLSSLDPPSIEESIHKNERNEVEKPEVDGQTAKKMAQNYVIQDINDAFSDLQQLHNEHFDFDGHTNFEQTGCDTGYNTSASSSETFDCDRNDSSLESKISDSSLEIDGPTSIAINKDDAKYLGIKVRYTPTNSGRLAMNGVDSNDRNEIPWDEELSSFMNRNQIVVRQESMETCRNPVQTEPSLNSNQFINLKQERQTQVVRPKRPSLKVTVPSGAEQVPHSQQQGVPLESYVKLHTQDAPTLHGMSSAQNTPEDIRDETMSSEPGVSFNSARSENETPLTTESGFHHLDLCSITSEYSEFIEHDNGGDNDNNRDDYIEPAAIPDVFGITSQFQRENLNTCPDMETANCCSTSATTNSTRSLDRNWDEFSASMTNSSVSGNNGSITELKRRQIEANFSNAENDRSGVLRGNGNPQSGSWSTLSSLGIGIAAGMLMVVAYNKLK